MAIRIFYLIIVLFDFTNTKIFYDQEIHKNVLNDYEPYALPSNNITRIGMRLAVYGIKEIDTMRS